MMSEHQRQTAFLRQCLVYEDSAERHQLEARITQLECDERSVRRAVWLMAFLAALAMAGLGYAAVFLADYPLNASQFATLLVIKILITLGGGSLICLVTFLGLGVTYRRELDGRREECRRLATRILESRLGQPFSPPTSIQADPAAQKAAAEIAVLADALRAAASDESRR
jgi:formate hydrogenlyase subunit 3/multisubunit Na+/H+ antiporter MnhD subunit